MVKRLRRRPLTAESGVRFPMEVPKPSIRAHIASFLHIMASVIYVIVNSLAISFESTLSTPFSSVFTYRRAHLALFFRVRASVIYVIVNSLAISFESTLSTPFSSVFPYQRTHLALFFRVRASVIYVIVNSLAISFESTLSIHFAEPLFRLQLFSDTTINIRSQSGRFSFHKKGVPVVRELLCLSLRTPGVACGCSLLYYGFICDERVRAPVIRAVRTGYAVERNVRAGFQTGISV